MIRLLMTNGVYAVIRPQESMRVVTNEYANYLIGLARTKQKLGNHKISILC